MALTVETLQIQDYPHTHTQTSDWQDWSSCVFKAHLIPRYYSNTATCTTYVHVVLAVPPPTHTHHTPSQEMTNPFTETWARQNLPPARARDCVTWSGFGGPGSPGELASACKFFQSKLRKNETTHSSKQLWFYLLGILGGVQMCTDAVSLLLKFHHQIWDIEVGQEQECLAW